MVALSPAVLASDLSNLPTVIDTTSHRASSYDVTGGNEDSLVSFAPRTTEVLLDIDGPGRINHMWFTLAVFPGNEYPMRDLLLRIYWENSPVPSVEVPLGDFFGLGHGRMYTLQSAPIAVGSSKAALNCYWPMPFYKHARVELYNNGRRSYRRVYYHIDYERGPQPPHQALFHALYRRDKQVRSQPHGENLTGRDNYVILDTQGTGHYVGTALFVDAQPGGWWGEGDDMIFIDGNDKPAIIGTGSEDYFGNAWGFDEPFSYPFYGCPLLEKRPDGGAFTSVYRWHLPDPIRFRKSLRVTIEHTFGKDVVNDYSSVAYWYQTTPITQREPIPYAEENHPRNYDPPKPQPASFELEATELEPLLLDRNVKVRAITTDLHDGYTKGGWLRIETQDQPVEVPIRVPEPGRYRVQLRPVNHLIERPLEVRLNDNDLVTITKIDATQHRVGFTDLGNAAARDGTLTLTLSGNPMIGLDHLKVEKVAAQEN